MTATSIVDPDQLARHIASMYRDVAYETGHDLHRAYRFASERAQRTSDKYGAQTIELLAVKPTEETSR
jgi:hypothetical protein